MKNLNFQAHQEIYNASVKHLLAQGRTALLARGGDAYRGYCGGCPVGSFIKASDYLTAIEGVTVRCVIERPDGRPSTWMSAWLHLGAFCCACASTSTIRRPSNY